MAVYYQSSSEIQADGGLQTLYLMNPNYVGYSDTQPSMHFLNPASSSAAAVMPHAPLHHAQHFMGIPLSHDRSRPLPLPSLALQQDIPAAAAQTPIPRLHYNMWGLVDQPQQNMPQQTPRGLSLSLSAHHQTAFDRSPGSGDHDFRTSVGIMSPKNCSSPSLNTTEPNGVNTMQSAIMGSKYLKAAQELLDEVVNVGNDPAEARRDKAKAVKDSGPTHRDTETGIKSELTTAQRQEIQMKKSKLNSMLEEVEQRCTQYHQQMQIVVAAFEQAAGSGSARAYTQLALKTILKQFRCLKSIISAQIKALNKSLGEEESLEHRFEGSRLKFVDTQLRQQRALQQLGMMQNNAWRPQRGLPERAVSVLRSWLFEHFLHPYPKDMDKQILAKQTGLTRSQVSNWFINARVRLWKPMVEEMYLEETKNHHDASTKPETDNKPARAAPSPPPEISASTLTTASPLGPSLPARANLAHLINSLNTDNLQPEKSPKKPRNAINLSADNQMEGGDGTNVAKFSTENYLSMAAAANVNRYGIGELDQQLAAAAGFQGNSFSLSLALQPIESSPFLPHRNFEFGTRIDSGAVEDVGGAASHPGSIGYEILDFQTRKPFPAQLLPDFVA